MCDDSFSTLHTFATNLPFTNIQVSSIALVMGDENLISEKLTMPIAPCYARANAFPIINRSQQIDYLLSKRLEKSLLAVLNSRSNSF